MKQRTKIIIAVFSSLVAIGGTIYGIDTYFNRKGQATKEIYQQQDAIVILNSVTVVEMQNARKILEKYDVKVQNIFPPSAFIAQVPSKLPKELQNPSIFAIITPRKLDPKQFSDYESSTRDAIYIWNQRLDEKGKPAKEEEKPKEDFKDEVKMPQDLPKTKEEKIKKDQEYLARWQKTKKQFQKSEELKKQQWQKKRPKSNKKSAIQLASAQGSVAGVQTSQTSGFGKAYGAGFFDISLYMTGDIAIGVFFTKDSETPEWTSDEINTSYNSITNSFNQFISEEPNANIAFTFIKEVDAAGQPNPLPEGDYNKYYTYDNNLRNLYNTHWANAIIIRKEPEGVLCSGTFAMGSHIEISRPCLDDVRIIRHELMHEFGAADQYNFVSPTYRAGFLNIVNANSIYNNGTGFYGGAGEGLSDLMLDLGPITNFSRGQVGWRDSDGNGILDPTDTFPNTEILNKIGSNPITYSGVAIDLPIRNNHLTCDGCAEATINFITNIEYRINNSAWQPIQSSDGQFDYGREEFNFTLPELKNGQYTIEIRATNSVGNNEKSYAKDTVDITGSTVNNVKPFPSFSINPLRGSNQTNFTFDASFSTDLEDGQNLEYRWDFENNNQWTQYSPQKTITHQYQNEGIKIIRLEAKDSAGLTNIIFSELQIFSTNISPQIILNINPESQHNKSDTFSINLNASESYDGEDSIGDLEARWDFNNDGLWDTNWSNNLNINHIYQLEKTLPSTMIYTSKDGTHPWGAAIEGNYLYLASGLSGLNIFDISSPMTPILIGNFPTQHWAKDVAVSGDYAYLLDEIYGLKIIDKRNPDNLILIGSLDTPGNAISITISGIHAFIADSRSGLEIVDITDPYNPILDKNYNPHTYCNDVVISGNLAYLTTQAGLDIIDISDPHNPLIANIFPLKVHRIVFI